jgi:ribonucleoside-diphosphate reductase alpha chain
MNLAKYDEWKNTDAVYYATWFLDAVLQEFIEKAKSIKGFERAVRFSEKSRAIGLGVMGFHTLLQDKMLPVDSFETFKLNAEIFKLLDKESLRASKDLAREYGEPEWCEGFGVRNTHRIALAPTVSNSIISGNVSPSNSSPITKTLMVYRPA